MSLFSFIKTYGLGFALMAGLLQASPVPEANAPIKIGMSTALSGPVKFLGEEMVRGVRTYFSKINAQGGIQGRKLELIVLDDQYEPSKTEPNIHQLIDKDNVLALLGNVGTAPAVVTIPLVKQKKVLLFGVYSGAGVLRKTPPDRYVLNYRASYEEETAAIIKNLLAQGIKPEEIAFFTQNDVYGDAGYFGAYKALKAAGYADADYLAHGRYTRNTTKVEVGLSQILSAPITPKVIIMVGTYEPVAKFIKLAKKSLPNALFLSVSFVGSAPLMQALGKDSENLIVMQVVPMLSSQLPAVREYQEDLKKYGGNSTANFTSLEGYLVAKLFVKGLEKAASEHKLTREGVIDALESMPNIDIGIGIPLGFSKEKHQASHMVWPSIIQNGTFKLLDWNKLKEM